MPGVAGTDHSHRFSLSIFFGKKGEVAFFLHQNAYRLCRFLVAHFRCMVGVYTWRIHAKSPLEAGGQPQEGEWVVCCQSFPGRGRD